MTVWGFAWKEGGSHFFMAAGSPFAWGYDTIILTEVVDYYCEEKLSLFRDCTLDTVHNNFFLVNDTLVACLSA